MYAIIFSWRCLFLYFFFSVLSLRGRTVGRHQTLPRVRPQEVERAGAQRASSRVNDRILKIDDDTKTWWLAFWTTLYIVAYTTQWSSRCLLQHLVYDTETRAVSTESARVNVFYFSRNRGPKILKLNLICSPRWKKRCGSAWRLREFFDWHQGLWPWRMTLNGYKFDFFPKFALSNFKRICEV